MSAPKSEARRCVEVVLHGHPRLWMRRDDFAKGEGPLMPEPDHDINTIGMGVSYAHLFGDGVIRRYRMVIGKRDDLRATPEGDAP